MASTSVTYILNILLFLIVPLGIVQIIYVYDFHKAVLKPKQMNITGSGDRDKDQPSIESNARNTNNRTGLVLVYTPFFGDWKYAQKALGRTPFTANKCRYDNCIATKDRSKQDVADAVLFHCRDKPAWPWRRYPNQIYALFCLEAPVHSSFKQFGARINATATYRRDSDMYTPYFRIARRHTPLVGKYIPKYDFRKKPNAAIWVVSNCHTPVRREDYVAELAKYYKVNIVGKCGSDTCTKTEKKVDCDARFEKEHKFYLAFENSFCVDYVTAKLTRGLHNEMVPVVMGGANYSLFAPKHSYINAADYDSPKQLANYLNFLSENQEEYEKYFQWKQKITFDYDHNGGLFCALCEMISKKQFHKPAAAKSLSDWWSPPGVCYTDGYTKKLQSPNN